MGKHVYCQKPLTHSIYESRLLTMLASKHNVATQMGNQGNSHDDVRQLCEWIWNNEIGEVKEVHAWTDRPIWPQGIPRPMTKCPPQKPSTGISSLVLPRFGLIMKFTRHGTGEDGGISVLVRLEIWPAMSLTRSISR